MIVPDFWAEAKRRELIGGSQVTIKRFGWSNESSESALKNAQERVDEAMLRAMNGEKVRKVDHKVSYNGGEGLPIREEVVSRYENVVLTRNSYGALCLNTPDVLFADVDLNTEPTQIMWALSIASLILLAVLLGLIFLRWLVFFGALFLTLVLSSALAEFILKVSFMLKGSSEKQFRELLSEYASMNEEMNLRLYRTPNGFRVLALHKLYDPNSKEVADIFQSLGVDRIYSQMCRNQNCFRARVSPKPWRIGVKRMGPRPGTWPIKRARMNERASWVRAYDQASKNYSSCVLDSEYGSDTVDPKAEIVLKLHDDYSRVGSGFTAA